MSSYRCSQCGSRITVEAGVKVSTCPVCQALFVLPNQFEKKENLYLLAADARHGGKYDAALNYYGKILKVDGAEPEANWGYLLSKYGVEISENALDYGGVIFHRVEHGSFGKDPAYEKMMTYLPKESRYYYETIARRIEARHKKLMEISKQLTAPDIYINCTMGQNTEDYLLSVQAGKALEDAGYRIFHSGMLRNVSRDDLNLYEMAAAEKAEAMIVIATGKTDWEDARFGALWKRFYAYRKNDAGRKMLSVFRGMRPEELPLELQGLQSVACEGADFQKKLTEEINRMFGRQNRSASLVRENLGLLREGQTALEEGRYEDAGRIFEKAVANDGEEYRAHFGMVCALTENLKKPVLSDRTDHSYRQTLQFAEKAFAEECRKKMSSLMKDAAWEDFLKKTNRLQDFYVEEKPEVLKSEERIKLYLPAFDSRFQELEDWHKGCSRQRELDRMYQAYQRRDTAAEPLFAEQEKKEHAYENTAVNVPERMKGGKLRAFLLELSLVMMAVSYMTLLINFRYTTGYTTGYYKVSVVLFAASLAGIVFWAYLISGSQIALWGGVIAAIALYKFSRAHIRNYQLFLMLLPAVLLFVERIMMMVYSWNLNESLNEKRRAALEVQRMEEQIASSYQNAMERICAKYPLPKGKIPELTVSHSKHYQGLANFRKPKPAALYPLRAVGFLVILLFALTFVNNQIYASGWKNVVRVENRFYHVLALREDGTVKAAGRNDAGQCEVSSWEDVTDIGVGFSYSAGLTKDGKVLIAAGEDDPVQAAAEWTEIAVISAGYNHLAGLRTDGTVVVAGPNAYGENDTQEWTDVLQVKTGSGSDASRAFTYGVRSDGSLLMAGNVQNGDYTKIKESLDKEFGPGEDQAQAVALYGNTDSMLVRTRDEQIKGLGNNALSQLTQAEEWDVTEISDIRVSSFASVGLRKDGTVQIAGNTMSIQKGAYDWQDIVKIDLCGENCLGLKSDGTVVAAGSNKVKEQETGRFKNIVEIDAGELASYGIREDGSVDAAGYSYLGITYTRPKNPLGLLQFWYQALKW